MAQRDESSEDEKPLKKRKLSAGPQSSHAAAEQRLNDNLEASNTAEIASARIPEITRHPTLWFADGLLIVIASDGIAFKLHPGILARHSEIFKERLDTFSAPVTSQSEGASLARTYVYQETTLHLPENGDDLSELFNIIYDGEIQSTYYDHDSRIPFYHFYRILRLGVKYKVQHIVKSGFARLEEVFPSDYDLWMTTRKAFSEGESSALEMQAKDTVPLILLAREAQRTSLLPVLFYTCVSEADSSSVLEGVSHASETFRLDVADQITYANAHRKFREIETGTEEIFLRGAFDGLKSQCSTRQTCISACRHMLEAGRKSNNFHDGIPFTAWDGWIDETDKTAGEQTMCLACKKHLKSEILEHARKQWDRLGEIFNVSDWAPPKRPIAGPVAE